MKKLFSILFMTTFLFAACEGDQGPQGPPGPPGDEGTIQYVYNHTAGDVEVLIDGNFDLSNLDSFFVENQTFRIVVLPSDTFAEDTGINVSSYNAVMNALDLKESDVKKVEAIK